MPAGSSGGVALSSTLMACGINVVFLLLMSSRYLCSIISTSATRTMSLVVRHRMVTVSLLMTLSCKARARRFVYSNLAGLA